MTIGERLEDARKRKGVSIREAAEATKIRGDYLLAMENNSYDINLPDIYVRGFLRNYARFLKLDDHKLIADFDSVKLSGRSSRAERRALAQQAAPTLNNEGSEEDVSAPVTQSSRQESLGTMKFPSTTGFADPHSDYDDNDDDDHKSLFTEDKIIYVKVGLGIAGVFVSCLIIWLLVSLIGGGDNPEINPDLASSSTQSSTVSNNTPVSRTSTAPAEGPDEVTFVALSRVMIIVDQKKDNKRLYQGTLAQGERYKVQADGPIVVRYDNGDGLMVERRGRSFRMGQAGMGYNSIQ
ncbi:MAG: DUF4115 domain-containing protein [Opitutales bacterium]|nr:DUF4115 domain-containing protein [Opitutales bacterium]